tara:strand:- start:865 stop:1338 length:474 start_codon:yes stop_codon:yes gene_type:complete
MNDQLIKKALTETKTIAMVGVSYIDESKESSSNIRRRPSIIVMKYLQEFGYNVIPVNPNSAGKKINEQMVVSGLEEIKTPVDIVNVFRPSKETPSIARQVLKIKAKILWLQYGIENEEAKKIAESANIMCIQNKCIKQEYQRLFLKVRPVFPVLQNK